MYGGVGGAADRNVKQSGIYGANLHKRNGAAAARRNEKVVEQVFPRNAKQIRNFFYYATNELMTCERQRAFVSARGLFKIIREPYCDTFVRSEEETRGGVRVRTRTGGGGERGKCFHDEIIKISVAAAAAAVMAKTTAHAND